jgi:hypothetical protein
MAAVKPNRNLRALMDNNPAFCAQFEQEKGGNLIHFMNVWANLHAKDPAKAFAVMDLIEQEQGKTEQTLRAGA